MNSQVTVLRQKNLARRPHRWLAIFFAFGASMCALTVILLCFPGTSLDLLWHLNPYAQKGFCSIGKLAVLLMCLIGGACTTSAIGLWHGFNWGRKLALVILSLNIIGDLHNLTIRHDYRALIGLPIAGAMIFHLASRSKES